jgi:hypothetical protein
MLGGSRVTCSHQFDTDAFLVTIELRQSMKTFKLTMADYRKPNWLEALLKPLNDWLGRIGRPRLARI